MSVTRLNRSLRLRRPSLRDAASRGSQNRPSASLSPSLLLSKSVFQTGLAPGTVIGTLRGLTPGSTPVMGDSASGAVAYSNGNLVVGPSAPTGAQVFPVSVDETLNGVTVRTTFVMATATTPEAVSYFARMATKPASAALTILDTMISTLRASTVWAKLDTLYFLAQDTYQGALLNIMGFYPLTVVGTPTFTARNGVTGASGASLTNGIYLNSGVFQNYTLNSAHLGVFITQPSASTTAVLGTIADFTAQLLPRSGGGNFGSKVNTGTTTAVAVASRAGHFTASRTAANANASYQNGGAALATSTNASVSLPNSPLYVFNDAGNFATDQVAAVHTGAGLTQAENQTLYNALNTAISAMSALGAPPAASTTDYDLVVYGGTLSGLMAAQRAANRGARVALVEPTPELGGVGHQGLTYFDLALRGAFGFLNRATLNFFVAINKVYTPAATTPAQRAEPKIYDQIFASTLTQTRAATFLSSPLLSSADVRMAGGAISAIRTASGWITGRQFIDASYTMDLGACAGAPFQLGRESQSTYGEPAAGFAARRKADGGWNYSIDNVTPNNLYPVKPKPSTADGAGDGLIQPMSFRFPITTAANRLPFPVPPGGYVASKMDQLVAVIKNYNSFASVVYVAGDTALQNNKFCINNGSSVLSVDLPGPQSAFPNGDAATRQAVVDEVKTWTLHLLYCLQNDPRLTSALRADAALYGLCADEFTSNPIPGFPNYPYIREGRRLKGRYVVTQNDLYTADNPSNTTSGARTNYKPDRIGQWNYIVDSHAMEMYSDSSGGTSNIVVTGNIGGPGVTAEVDTWDIPFRAITTDPNSFGHVSNLTVPVCFSASSIAWMTGRMEPNFAQLGEAAAEAALIAAEDGIDITAVPYDRLSRRIGSPINTAAPVLTGSTTVGQTLTVTTGTWNFNPTKFDYVWKRDGITISGSPNAASYTTVSDDIGHRITCAVIPTNLTSSAQALSNSLVITA